MLSKDSKIRVLENFYALDYVFFGKPVNEVDMCCPLVKEEYLSVKGALMSVFIEMLKLVDHKPSSLTEKVDSSGLVKLSRKSAKIARENSEKIVTSKKAKQNIKEALREAIQEDKNVDVTAVVEKTIRTKAFGLAVDNLLVARTIKESKDISALDEWEGKIVEDSYKILRDSLVEVAYMMIYETTDESEEGEEEEDKKKVSNEKEPVEEKINAQSLNKKTVIGAAALAGGALVLWKKNRDKKLRTFCSTKGDPGTPEYNMCLVQGHKKMKADLERMRHEALAYLKIEKIIYENENLTEIQVNKKTAAAAAALGAGALLVWKRNREKKLKTYCALKAKKGTPEYKLCMVRGTQSMKDDLQRMRDRDNAQD